MQSVPDSPAALAATLAAVFPDFHVSAEDEELSYHSVMREFATFFGARASSASEAQFRSCAELLVRCSAAPGALENAVDTCFLEHTRQLKVSRQLDPLLREASRRLQQ